MQLIRSAEVGGVLRDVIIDASTIAAVQAPRSASPSGFEDVWDAHGGALLPGLHDHHIHLAALAASRASIICGPPDVTTEEELEHRVASAPTAGWIRGVGYHESVAGCRRARRWTRSKRGGRFESNIAPARSGT